MINISTASSDSLPHLRKIAPVFMALLVVLCAGCSWNPDFPPVPDAQRNIEVDYDYILGPGDSVDIFVWGNAGFEHEKRGAS